MTTNSTRLLVNTDQAEAIEANGGTKASQSVLHEVLESYTALKIGTGIHIAGTPEAGATYLQAHNVVNTLPAASTKELELNLHKDEGKAYPGYDTYFHDNPTTGRQVILFKVKI